MRVELTYRGQYREFDLPEGVSLAGVTLLWSEGGKSEVLSPNAPAGIYRSEEVLSAEDVRVILYCYDSPAAAEVAREFGPFTGMAYIEYRTDALQIILRV